MTAPTVSIYIIHCVSGYFAIKEVQMSQHECEVRDSVAEKLESSPRDATDTRPGTASAQPYRWNFSSIRPHLRQNECSDFGICRIGVRRNLNSCPQPESAYLASRCEEHCLAIGWHITDLIMHLP